ncbi:unnamed protein product [Didymodactylos carnosus]|uniref:Uncharacterized protein n=1 Tax=Didymodactylos carnosus TaxID=1234261 RepID=A0A8S2DH72_9BILA|nr:unnamed protein product [Didymodactylos carnosus]CAF3696184.1 unnamed protein product [Didymodactylos carnosus]
MEPFDYIYSQSQRRVPCDFIFALGLKSLNRAVNNEYKRRKFPPFEIPKSNYDIVFVHRETPIRRLDELIKLVLSTTVYSVDTESEMDFKQKTSHPALIQIETVSAEHKSTIILIEVAYLPPPRSPLFQKIKQLCYLIFNSGNTLQSWGDLEKELQPFAVFDLFDVCSISSPANIQARSKVWFEETHPSLRDLGSSTAYDEENGDGLVLSAWADDPEFLPKLKNPYTNPKDEWSLQVAIETIFQLFLDKQYTISKWRCGLDEYLSTHIHPTLVGPDRTNDIHTQLRRRAHLINYAIRDCQAVTQLVKYMNEHPAKRTSPPQRIVELIDHLSSSTTQDSALPSLLTQHSLLEDYSYHEAISARTPIASPPAPLIASLVVQSEGLIVNPSNSLSSIAPPPKSKHSQRSADGRTHQNYLRSVRRHHHRYNHSIIRPLHPHYTRRQISIRLRGLKYTHFRMDTRRRQLIIAFKERVHKAIFNQAIGINMFKHLNEQ